VVAKIKEFLVSYRDVARPGAPKEPIKYARQIIEIKHLRQKVLDIHLDDVKAAMEESVLLGIEGNASRYQRLFCDAVDDILKNDTAQEDDFMLAEDDLSPEAVIMHHRKQQYRSIKQEAGEDPDEEAEKNPFPKALTQKYELHFVARTTEKRLRLRDVSGTSLGHLVQVQAIVLRATDVKPLLEVASSSCDRCGWETYAEVKSRSFMPETLCRSKECQTNGVRGKLYMQSRRSKFKKYQELKLQELPEHVPAGNIPRTMTIVCKGELTRVAKAGDCVVIGGVFLPTPYTGNLAVRAGLTTDTYLEAHSIECLKGGTETVGLSAETEKLIEEVALQDAYSLLSRSLAPEIFGLEDVKKCLLLQLVGGVTRQQGDGMRTRGDINVCLMGDPGVAKSQLLKHIAKVAPRCVYTTGKGSSGVGLTAAVVRDPMTNELMLEGGALVLADKGICCIDEFDKMEEVDRTAIHEVMEQQTVSIAKAGITTTLNARTAILAAANPKFGRYNRLADRDAHAALLKNINLPAALLSRFDLMFLLLDETDRDNDLSLAEHITYVHQHEHHPPLGFKPFDAVFLRLFISVAKTFVPSVPPELAGYITEAYVEIRSRDKQRALERNSSATTTARQLLSILRLAEAHAKLNFSTVVRQDNVDEAIRLIQMSKASVLESDADLAKGSRSDPVSRIWTLVSPKLNSGYCECCPRGGRMRAPRLA
jgi:DNA replication licensing factor MCM7